MIGENVGPDFCNGGNFDTIVTLALTLDAANAARMPTAPAPIINTSELIF